MELLLSNLSRVQIPKPTDCIYKHECCISFDTPRSEGGLFVDMNSFLAFGKDYVFWNYEKTGNPVYFHIKETAKPLTIGVDGGLDNKKPAYEESYSIVILPDFVSLPFPSVKLPEKVKASVDTVLSAVGAERKNPFAVWSAEKKKVSKHARRLKQINGHITIPASGWKCAKCDRKDNLWLNLTDGMILCGRKYGDTTGGGDNHSAEHYEDTGYPLVVKLGTITADLEAADFRSYAEPNVYDPLLPKHLSHFGINFSSLQKTEMTTDERELDHNTNFDWNRIQELNRELVPARGRGYTGLVNLGSSCYLAATMQIVFSTHSFIRRYFLRQSLKNAFMMATADPTLDLNMQLTKLGHGLLSGKYSVHRASENDAATGDTREEGIPPRMFKSVIAAGHAGFSSMRQQDPLEFFLHLLDKVGLSNSMNPHIDPSTVFKFRVQEEIYAPCGRLPQIRYRECCILSLSVPLDKISDEARGPEENDMSSEEFIRPRVPLEACLATFLPSSPKGNSGIIKKSSMASFPNYLVLHIRKFVMEARGRRPEKLDVYINVPDVLDITYMRSKGLQSNGVYELFGIVSHIGTSTHRGHYVAHVLKAGRWVIFNDSKVSFSTDPPKDLGYLYFFKRVSDRNS